MGGHRKAILFVAVVLAAVAIQSVVSEKERLYRNAYASMMYMGTPRDYEFYVATRVMLRSLAKLKVEADLVVIASLDVPIKWVQAMYVRNYYNFFPHSLSLSLDFF